MAFLAFMVGPIGRPILYAIVALGALGWFVAHEQHVGAVKAVKKIEKQNKEAVHVAVGIRKKVQSVCAANPVSPQCVRDGWTRDN